jgi:hypothetical protein
MKERKLKGKRGEENKREENTQKGRIIKIVLMMIEIKC